MLTYTNMKRTNRLDHV